MPRVAVLDACVLYPAALRDLLLRCAEVGLYSPRWSAAILDEFVGALARNRPDISAARLERLKTLMVRAFPEAMVEPQDHAVLGLPDLDDRHVVDAVGSARADCLVTFNVRHFRQGVIDAVTTAKVVTPDDFLQMLLSEDETAVVGALERAASALRNPPMKAVQFLGMLAEHAPEFVERAGRVFFGR